MFNEELRKFAAEIEIELNAEQLEKFEIFYKLVIEWNAK